MVEKSPRRDETTPTPLDVLIVGAGISGINTAYRLQTEMPEIRFAVVEGRNEIGGTWDLFQYPGVRSDSPLHTYGFAWHPWPHATPIAEGPLIMSYLKECVATYGLGRYIQLGHRVRAMDWSSKTKQWTVEVRHNCGGGGDDEEGGQIVTKYYTASFVVLGTGYYDYDTPLQTYIPGIERFGGDVIHPQFWPTNYDHSGKKMVIIGSGATAVTLLPTLSEKAAHVTMLQRSPTYIVSATNCGPTPEWLAKWWPRTTLAAWERGWFLVMPWLFTILCRHFPNQIRAVLRRRTQKQLPPRLDFDPNFKPAYNPWDQRMCLCPDGDFYQSLHTGRADVVTSHIETVTEKGIQLRDGRTLEADVLVTATGLRMTFGGHVVLTLDGGDPVPLPEKCLWNGAMLQDVPNLFFMIGYTRNSWTLGADDTAFILTRLLRFMAARGVREAVPRAPREWSSDKTIAWELSSTYVKAAEDRVPKYGTDGPWRPRGNIVADYVHSRWGDVTKGLHFGA